jgi:hypothetical protein
MPTCTYHMKDIDDIKEKIDKLSQAEITKEISKEFFQNILFSIRLLSEFGLKSASRKIQEDVAKYFINKVGDDRFMKIINSLAEINPTAPKLEWSGPKKRGWPKGLKRGKKNPELETADTSFSQKEEIL